MKKFEMPKYLMGKKLEEWMKEDSKSPGQEQEQRKIILPSSIDLEKYIQIPKTNIIIAREETLKGKNWNQSHDELKLQSLFMPEIPMFLSHFLNVKEAYEGKTKLYLASGKELNKAETEDLYKYLTTGHRNGCWTWLDAYFEKRNNERYILTRNKSIANKLDAPIMNINCYVDLSFNSQGMPIQKSSNQSYEQGKNINYWYPKENCVAGFDADSGRADLDCYRVADGSNPSLGVFACAEGAVAQNSQGSKIK